MYASVTEHANCVYLGSTHTCVHTCAASGYGDWTVGTVRGLVVWFPQNQVETAHEHSTVLSRQVLHQRYDTTQHCAREKRCRSYGSTMVVIARINLEVANKPHLVSRRICWFFVRSENGGSSVRERHWVVVLSAQYREVHSRKDVWYVDPVPDPVLVVIVLDDAYVQIYVGRPGVIVRHNGHRC